MAGVIRKLGRWDLAGELTRELKIDIRESNEIVLKQIGLLGEKWVVKWIQHQPGVWAPLSEEYKEWKIKKGYSSMMLRRTSTLINSITSSATHQQVFIGVKRGKKYHKNLSDNGGSRDGKGRFTKKKQGSSGDGEDIANIAAIMEFGSPARGIPARRFLSPVYIMLSRKIRVEKLFSKYLMAHLKRKYGI